VIAFSRLVNASSSASVQGRVDGGGGGGGTRARDLDDIFLIVFQEPGFLRENKILFFEERDFHTEKVNERRK